ncbi:MAG TPA: PAS domain S-box protein [Burkholderiales bacterium]|nr:PAS domain S-box protein [Burkholderiales bacterium]
MQRFASDFARAATLVAAYYIAGRLGLSVATAEGGMTIAPAAGISLAALLLFGYRLFPAVLVGAFLLSMSTGTPHVAAFGVALGATLQALGGAYVLKWIDFDPNLRRGKDVFKLFVFGAAASSVFSAGIGVLSLAFAGGLPWDEVFAFFGAWWRHDAVGVTVVAPILLGWHGWSILKTKKTLELAVLLLAAAAVAILVFLEVAGDQTFRLGFLVFPVLVWSALRFSLREAAIVLLLTASIALYGIAHSSGPFAADSASFSIVLLQSYLAVAALMTLTLSAGVSERKFAQREMSRSEKMKAAVLDSALDAVITMDHEGKIVDFNRAAVQIFGYSRERAIGQELAQLIIPMHLREAHQNGLKRFLATGEATMVGRRIEVNALHESGCEFPVELEIVPLMVQGSTIFTGYIRDISERKQAEADIQRARQRLDFALEGSNLALWDTDVATGKVYLSKEAAVMVGDPAQEKLTTVDELFALVHPDDVEALHALSREVVQGRVHEYRSEHRVRTRSGDYKWVLTRGKVVERDADGRALRMTGTYSDITDRKQAEDALRESEEKFRLITENVRDLVAMLDVNGRRIYNSPSYRTFFSDAAIARGADSFREIYPEDRDRVRQVFRDTVATGIGRRTQYRFLLEDGSIRHIESEGSAVLDASGKVSHVVVVSRDITERMIAEKALRNSEERFRSLVQNLSDMITIHDAQGITHYESPSAARILGYGPGGLMGKSPFETIHPKDLARVKSAFQEVLQTTKPVALNDFRYRRADGTWIHLEVMGINLLDHPAVKGVVLTSRDITERKHAEHLLRESEQRFRDVVNAAGEYIWEVDVQWNYTYASERVERTLGYSEHELLGRSFFSLMPDGEANRVREWFREKVPEGQSFRYLEHKTRTKYGDVIWQQVSGVPILGPHGRALGYRGTALDITDRKRAEARIEYLATRDALTDLPNRMLLNDRVEQAIVNAHRNFESFALLFIDLDRFKTINDSLGHHVGDQMLKQVAERLLHCVRERDTVARPGGDEFVVAIYDLKNSQDAGHIAQKILNSLSQPFSIENNVLNTSCSIGISTYPNDGENVPTLMKNADTAMYHAKEKGRSNYQFFSAELNRRAVERLQMENELRRAIEREEFVLYYQPQVDLQSGDLLGLEALLRWRHPARGLVHPGKFIALAEETGLIVPLGEWVLNAACRQIRTWNDARYPQLTLAVNLSAAQLVNNKGFAKMVSAFLQEHQISSEQLEFEMTESMLLANVEENTQVLKKLGDLGTRITIDDFGTGYSSLSYLKRLPIDKVKIDRSFVRDIVADSDDATIVSAIIAMAHNLKLSVIAEGVENREQVESLRKLGCDGYQGHYFSKPLPAEYLEAKLLRPIAIPFAQGSAARHRGAVKSPPGARD